MAGPVLTPLLKDLLAVQGRSYPEVAPRVDKILHTIRATRKTDEKQWQAVKWCLASLVTKLPANGDGAAP